ncbi:SHOCT domain-containing protein [Nocardioides ungokensis]|uniref:SHOCT domain-containing protein n=1 Tax=Nocardioides ungokensis TaxID=1643322 RepID=UPI0015DE3503|nr:SHOCT domain-containing protein [Nocardioides ungokensis]
MSFWDVVWFIVISFAFVAYLMVMFSIIADLFRDREESGVMKAVWIVCLIFFPLITALVYLIARGSGMADRQMQTAANMKEQQDAYIRDVAVKASPADQIAQAQKMLNDGAISQPEFERLKEKALA